MKILMLTAGSHGDVHPYLALARAAQSRGHEVRLMLHPYFEGAARAAGVPVIPTGASIDLESLIKDPRGYRPWTGSKFVFESMFAVLPEILAEFEAAIESERPDVVVAHVICFGARMIAERSGTPLVMPMLQPGGWMSTGDPVAVLQRSPGAVRGLLARLADAPLRPLVRKLMGSKFAALRKSLGLPPAKDDYFEEFRAGGLNLGLWSPLFRGPCRGDPHGARIVGFPWSDRPESRAAEADRLDRFIAAGSAPIVFTLGTTAVHVPGDFYAVAAATARRLRRRAVLLTGSPERARQVGESVSSGGDNVAAFAYAPYSRLLPRAAAIVHHGGIGSTAQALRAGRPAVVIPHAHDQFHNAMHCHRLGVGDLVHRSRLSVPRLERALRRVLDDPALAARSAALGAEIGREDGAVASIDEIERFVARAPRARSAAGVAS